MNGLNAVAGCGPEGKQFILGWILPDPADTSNPCFYVTAKEATTIELAADPAILALLSQTMYSVPTEGLRVCLPQDLFTDQKGKLSLTLRIHAEKDVQVFTGYEPFAIATTSVIPLDCLKKSETKYLVSSIPYGYINTMSVLSSTDGTTVNLELPDGNTIDFQLDMFHNYIKKADYLSGIIVHATAPVAVYAGQSCPYIPLDKNYCDTTYEMMPPVSSLSKYHIIPAMWPRGDFLVRVVTYTDGTQIVLRDNQGISLGSATKGRGEVWESPILTEAVVSVSCSQPCQVQQFSLGAEYDGIELGDPCAVLIPPVDRWGYHYGLYTQSTTGQHYAAIVIDSDASISGLTVNGNPVVGDFITQVIYNPSENKQYTVYYEALVAGTANKITNSGPDNFMVLHYLLEPYRQTCLAPWSLKVSPPIGP